jgi:hypothetical protein
MEQKLKVAKARKCISHKKIQEGALMLYRELKHVGIIRPKA